MAIILSYSPSQQIDILFIAVKYQLYVKHNKGNREYTRRIRDIIHTILQNVANDDILPDQLEQFIRTSFEKFIDSRYEQITHPLPISDHEKLFYDRYFETMLNIMLIVFDFPWK